MKTIVIALCVLAGFLTDSGKKPIVNATDPVEILESPGGSNLISDWITVHLDIIKTWDIPTHHNRELAYTGVALYESIVDGDMNYRSLSGQLNGYKTPVVLPTTENICWPASANSAMAKMLRFFYNKDEEGVRKIDALENSWRDRLISEGNSEEAVATGEEYGAQIANAVIEWSKSDGADKVNSAYNFPKGTGMWEPTPPNFTAPIMPYLGNARTFVKGSIDNTLPLPPPSFSTESQSAFYKMSNEVYMVSKQMNEDEREIGLFWDDFPNGQTLTAGGHWVSILKTVLDDQKISLIEGAQVYAGLFITENDAAIGCFKAKYTYNLIRPVTYIQKYLNHTDWNPLITTPPHPEYPAAHATTAMAGATILTKMLGDDISFTDNTYSYKGYEPHHFTSFKDAGMEAGISRLYGGIHYRPSIEAGFVQGEKIAENISNKLVFRN